MFEFSFNEFTSTDAVLAIVVLSIWILIFSRKISFYFIRYIKDRELKDFLTLLFTLGGVVVGTLVIFNFLIPML